VALLYADEAAGNRQPVAVAPDAPEIGPSQPIFGGHMSGGVLLVAPLLQDSAAAPPGDDDDDDDDDDTAWSPPPPTDAQCADW